MSRWSAIANRGTRVYINYIYFGLCTTKNSSFHTCIQKVYYYDGVVTFPLSLCHNDVVSFLVHCVTFCYKRIVLETPWYSETKHLLLLHFRSTMVQNHDFMCHYVTFGLMHQASFVLKSPTTRNIAVESMKYLLQFHPVAMHQPPAVFI